MEQLCMNLAALSSMHRFGDTLEVAIASISSDLAVFEVVRDAPDSIGKHWYGMRVRVTCSRTQVGFYLHVGLIYYPSTRVGLMIELDEQNNKTIYESVVRNIKAAPEFEINHAEPEYFKLFMPDETFSKMSTKTRSEQVQILQSYLKSGAEAIVTAAYEQGFVLDYINLSDALRLADAFDVALRQVSGELSRVKINYLDKDNFGQYASGYRYFLSDHKQTVTFYAYFGAIYSYKKQPSGIFAEIDWYSNQAVFDQTFAHMKENDAYVLSKTEPKFIKLFMPDEKVAVWNTLPYEKQMTILIEFLKTCNDEMIRAYQGGGEENE
jgi:hypothetical protein